MTEKTKKTSVKKALKIGGNILSVIAILFVVKKMLSMDVDKDLLFSMNTIWVGLLLIAIQVFIILTATFPWLRFVEILSQEKIPFLDAMCVFAKANIYKYIPGNVFQFVARNELAVRKSISHVDVAMATLLDTIVSLLVAFLISIALLRDSALNYLSQYGNLMRWGLVAFLALAILLILLCHHFRGMITEKFVSYRACFSCANFGRLFQALLYYIFNNVMNGVMLLLVLIYIFHVDFTAMEMMTLIGAYLLSVIVGMITPGASGGIGIRETVMLLLTANQFSESVIVSAMVLLRIALIIADLVAYLAQMLLARFGGVSYGTRDERGAGL